MQWQPLNQPSLWEGSEDEALNSPQSRFRRLSPTWKVMLLSDGSVTRHLQLLTGSTVQVECLEMVNIGSSTEGLPPWAEHIQGPRVQRTVLLRAAQQPGEDPAALTQPSQQQGHGPPLVYAVSWWDAAEVDQYLSDKSKPIWVSLSQGHVELYREIKVVYQGHSPELEQLLGVRGPFWGRQYLFCHNDKPLTLIYEVFSPQLERYLGPQDTTP